MTTEISAPVPTARPRAGGAVRLVGLTKRFGDVEALAGIDLDIEGGEFFSLLGPSGCGKTTTLRLIAGFEQPTAGEVRVDGRDMARTPPHRRNVNTVFQSYALFPFLSVHDNVAFGLRVRRSTAREARSRVREALALVRLEGLADRRPAQLSGGQQQRVALARALVLKPAVLLLDEPLGALDAQLRRALQTELKALQEAVGVTFVYVTHDQEEALTMSDRLAVMRDGRVEQVGTPAEVYEQPATAWVASFLGLANLFDAEALGPDGDGGCRLGVARAQLRAAAGDVGASGPVKVVIRPERVRLEPAGDAAPNRLPGRVERVLYLGPVTQLTVGLAAGATVTAVVANDGGAAGWRQGDEVAAHLPAEALRVLPTGPEGAGDGGEAAPAPDA
jgi:spermidine/putrescine transport system ATP-binding protein